MESLRLTRNRCFSCHIDICRRTRRRAHALIPSSSTPSGTDVQSRSCSGFGIQKVEPGPGQSGANVENRPLSHLKRKKNKKRFLQDCRDGTLTFSSNEQVLSLQPSWIWIWIRIRSTAVAKRSLTHPGRPDSALRGRDSAPRWASATNRTFVPLPSFLFSDVPDSTCGGMFLSSVHLPSGRRSARSCGSLRLERRRAEGHQTRKSGATKIFLRGRVSRGAEEPWSLPG